MSILKANYDNPFPILTVRGGEGADWDTFMSFIKISTDLAYYVTLTDGTELNARLVSYEQQEPFATKLQLYRAEAHDFTGDIVIVSLTDVHSMEVQ